MGAKKKKKDPWGRLLSKIHKILRHFYWTETGTLPPSSWLGRQPGICCLSNCSFTDRVLGNIVLGCRVMFPIVTGGDLTSPISHGLSGSLCYNVTFLCISRLCWLLFMFRSVICMRLFICPSVASLTYRSSQAALLIDILKSEGLNWSNDKCETLPYGWTVKLSQVQQHCFCF